MLKKFGLKSKELKNLYLGLTCSYNRICVPLCSLNNYSISLVDATKKYYMSKKMVLEIYKWTEGDVSRLVFYKKIQLSKIRYEMFASPTKDLHNYVEENGQTMLDNWFHKNFLTTIIEGLGKCEEWILKNEG
jgi:hypothetical protein